MFTKRSEAGNHGSDDDLISAYVDGRIDPEERAAFEARLRADPALRRQVDATRLLVNTARQLPVMRLPRNFVVPSTARAQQPVPRTQSLLRLGSAFAVLVFVAAVALDLSRPFVPQTQLASLAPTALAAPVMATAEIQVEKRESVPKEDAGSQAQPAEPTVAPEAANAPEALAAEALAAEAPTAEAPAAEPQAEAESAPAAATEPAQAARSGAASTTEPPAPKSAPAPQATAQPAADAPGVMAADEASPAATAEPTATEPTATMVTAAPAPETLTAQTTDLTAQAPAWLHVVAVVALLAAVVLGVLGWRRV